MIAARVTPYAIFSFAGAFHAGTGPKMKVIYKRNLTSNCLARGCEWMVGDSELERFWLNR